MTDTGGALRCRFCGRTVADLGGDAHAFIPASGWPGEYRCRNVIDCLREQQARGIAG